MGGDIIVSSMGTISPLKRIMMGIWLVSAGLLLSGTKACQEDYDLGSRSSGRETATPTPTPTETDDGLGEETPTPTPVPTGSPTATVSASPTPDTATAFLGALAAVAKEYSGKEEDSGPPSNRADLNSERGSLGGNWLGRSYVKESNDELFDSDGDGYSDDLERSLGTDPRDEYAQPNPGASVLMNRFRGVDDDYDGLSNADEAKLGTNPNRADTDEDEVRDGAEFASDSDPLDPASMPVDRDGDGLSDRYEEEAGTNAALSDSDNDKLVDSIEVAIGTNPLMADSDGDGILDGREYQSGSDPLVKDY